MIWPVAVRLSLIVSHSRFNDLAIECYCVSAWCPLTSVLFCASLYYLRALLGLPGFQLSTLSSASSTYRLLVSVYIELTRTTLGLDLSPSSHSLTLPHLLLLAIYFTQEAIFLTTPPAASCPLLSCLDQIFVDRSHSPSLLDITKPVAMHGSIGTQGRCTDSGPGIGELKSGRAGKYVEAATATAEVTVAAVPTTGLKVTLTSEYTISRDYGIAILGSRYR